MGKTFLKDVFPKTPFQELFIGENFVLPKNVGIVSSKGPPLKSAALSPAIPLGGTARRLFTGRGIIKQTL